MDSAIILVLFILLIIVVSLFCSPLLNRNGDSSEIQATRGFNIYNETTSLILISTSLKGDFERPVPVTIYPSQKHSFEVLLRVTPFPTTSTAIVTFDVVSGPLPGDTIGTLRVTMKVEFTLDPTQTIQVESFGSKPYRIDSGRTFVTVHNLRAAI
ncbi:hypothetical protein M3223_05185 [Paenibacillus pasadenensis]|nr:hypothetical protein [Paenibacillus pasadenensis]